MKEAEYIKSYLDPISRDHYSKLIDDNCKVIQSGLNYGLLIEGTVFNNIYLDAELQEEFFKIAKQCQSVIVCRASPAQKSQVVEFIRKKEPKVTTLAIGDGTNDVAMI